MVEKAKVFNVICVMEQPLNRTSARYSMAANYHQNTASTHYISK
jgi:hypothetical protein